MTNARDKANIPVLNFQSKGIDDNADATAITIDSSERVGINTTSPVSVVNIEATKTTALSSMNDFLTLGLTIDDDTSYNIGVGGGIAFRGKRNANGHQTVFGAIAGTKRDSSNDGYTGHLRFFTNNNSNGIPTEHLRIDNLGHVTIKGSTTSFDTTASLDGLQAYYETDSGLATLGSYSSGGSTSLAFHTNASGGASSEKMRINSSGQVGIGTSSPSKPLEIVSASQTTILHLNSTAGADANITFENTGSNDSISIGASSDDLKLRTDDGNILFAVAENSEKVRITSAGKVGIGTSTPQEFLDISDNGPRIRFSDTSITNLRHVIGSESNDLEISCDAGNVDSNSHIRFKVDGSEKMRIDSSGNVGIGTTTPIDKLDIFGTADNTRHITFRVNGNTGDASTFIRGTSNNSDGAIDAQDTLFIRSRHNIHLSPSAGADVVVIDGTTLPNQDNTFDLGTSAFRWDDVYATNGTINTSDQNQKQSIQFLTTAEMNVAKRLSALIKTFKWNSSVEEKGDSARTHTGIIAQDAQQAFNDEGLDANNYALFCSDTWWEKEYTIEATDDQEAQTRMNVKQKATDGYTKRTKLGVRYPELLSFIQAYNDQRFTELEARITTLEANNP